MLRHLFSIVLLIVCTSLSAQHTTKIMDATLVEEGFIFSNPPFKQCHASTVVQLSDGNLMAAWFGGTYERHPDVCIWGAIKSTDGWSQPVLLADGIMNDTLRYPTWNPVLFKTQSQELYLYYKVGPSPNDWWGMYKKSTDNGQTWSSAARFPDGLLGPIKNKPIYLGNGRIISPSSVENGDEWHAHMEVSDDDGQSWTKVPIDTSKGFKLIQPTLLTLSDGTILALMRSNQNCIVESRSTDNGNNWTVPQRTRLLNPNSGIDAVTLSSGLHVLVNNPAPSGKDWSDGRNKLYVMISADGENWQEVYKLEDNTLGEYSYPAIIETADGLVHITYTSNRSNIRHVVLKF
ncbi:exo-alpha-sialidase [Carboxylicivirga sp. A043]|uniref:sialidase family protein n=1 Tax=Carboxylicivirga litoralis TaxID=2816963 RepID=UPI0021CB5BBC|nr:sialidase family protein [Carboxylicivirga sp. A043]MCU4156791.1 exo-alpha-sialidase [Carboxylicivirga sp. A043]